MEEGQNNCLESHIVLVVAPNKCHSVVHLAKSWILMQDLAAIRKVENALVLVEHLMLLVALCPSLLLPYEIVSQLEDVVSEVKVAVDQLVLSPLHTTEDVRVLNVKLVQHLLRSNVNKFDSHFVLPNDLSVLVENDEDLLLVIKDVQFYWSLWLFELLVNWQDLERGENDINVIDFQLHLTRVLVFVLFAENKVVAVKLSDLTIGNLHLKLNGISWPIP